MRRNSKGIKTCYENIVDDQCGGGGGGSDQEDPKEHHPDGLSTAALLFLCGQRIGVRGG